jgi:alanyl-tRNA synthetase
MTSEQIRRQFIDYFVQKHGHTFVPSSPVVPHDDPSLLFTNAGMNQFKPIFLGQETRPYKRAANSQKCIRAGGKHNDLDDVGRSRRHHTFFEMLGNWSFGDYFKQGAIEMAWDLLTNVWKLDPTRLHVSCFEGDEKNGVPRDTEAADIWKRVAHLPDDHIHYFGKDNFWEMGETGPCGPCTEIYNDRTSDKTGGPQVNGDDPRVMEIWNLVFIQYNRDAAGTLTTLPSQHVDTGMGLERICQVLQGKDDNYGTDLFTPLFDRISQISTLKYTGLFPATNAADPVAEAANPQLRHDIAFRVIADHVRCLTFALTDGATPSNEGRGYVLRRILRRAVRFGRQQLELREPFLHTLVPVVVESMGEMFPELTRNPRRVIELIKDEEVSFGRTIDRGIDLFEEAANRAKANDEKTLVVSGNDAFKLHDTYGFPIDLTRIMAEERGMSVDIAGYEKLMEEARNKARAGGKAEQTFLTTLPPDALATLAKQKVKPTDDSPKFSSEPIQATVMAIWNGDDLGLSPADAFEDEELAIILDRTNFYSEMGGQVGDAGTIASATMTFDVQATRSVGGYVLHIGRIRTGKLRVTDTVTATVTNDRVLTEKNHTSTHLANWALREVLGGDVQQKGSLVDPEKLRFDFSHGKALADDELARVEMLVNESIAKKLPVYAETVPQEKALKIHGLRAVFGEKYPPMVRVVSIGAPVKELIDNPTDAKWQQFSIEFCGGTHLRNTADAGTFVITAEESVSKGIRRIVALTGDAAKLVLTQAQSVENIIKGSKKTSDAGLPPVIGRLQKSISSGELSLRSKRRAQAAVAELQDRYKKWEKSNKSESAASKLDVGQLATDLLQKASPLGAGKLVVAQIPDAAADQLLALTDSLKKKAGSYAILLASAVDGKVSFVAAVSDDLIAKGLKAGDWIRQAAQATGGGGGGRPQMAQAGGKDPTKLPEAIAIAKDYVMRTLKDE